MTNTTDIINALGLPADARVDQRVPKKLLIENGAPTTADKRHITNGIEELLWVAALKPTTIGVPAHHDDVREYLEIAVLSMELHAGARDGRLVELVHRAVPYPLLLLVEHNGHPGLSAAHKRWSQGEAGKTVLDGEIVSVEWAGNNGLMRSREDARENKDNIACFAALHEAPAPRLDALSISHQPRSSLYTLYQGWIDTLLALQVARLTGTFVRPVSTEHAAARREALQEYKRLDAEIIRLRTATVREKQLPRQVAMNIEVKRLQTLQAAARAKL